jgi:hypothetical protein
MLDMGSRVILINACISSIPMCMLSFYRMPISVNKRFRTFRNRLLWQKEQGARKYHLLDLETVCAHKNLVAWVYSIWT